MTGSERWPSASTIAGLLDDGKSTSFPWSAAGIAATIAVHRPDEWAHLGTSDCTHDKTGFCPACRYIRSGFSREWGTKADRGGCVHHLALSWARGETPDVPGACDPYMDSVAAFYQHHHPIWIEVERTVRYDRISSHGYFGQFDGIALLDCPSCEPGARCKWLLDWKTGGFYPGEQALQIAAYRYATHLTVWTPTEGKRWRCRYGDKADPPVQCENPVPHDHCKFCGVEEQHRPYSKRGLYTETVDKPMIPVAHAGVVLLDPEYGGQLVELPANGEAHSTFLRLRDAWGWSRQMETWAKENPVHATPNTREEIFA